MQLLQQRSSLLGIRGVVASLLLVYGLVSVGIGFKNSLRYSQDFEPVYFAARAWLSGLNPYSADAIHRITESLKFHEVEITVYPPPAVLVVSPLAMLHWKVARFLWATMNVILIGVCFLFMRRNFFADAGVLETTLLLAIWLSGIAIRVLVANGQHSLLILFFVLAYVSALDRNRQMAGGIGLGLTFYKFTWTPFFSILVATSRRNLRALWIAIALPLTMTLLFLARLGAMAPDAVIGYWQQLTLLTRVIDRDPGVGFSSVYPLLASTLDPDIARMLLYGIIPLVFILLVRIAPASAITSQSFGAVSLFCLWAVYHDLYDGLLLFVPLVALWRTPVNAKTTVRMIGRALSALSLVFWFAAPSKVAAVFTVLFPQSVWISTLPLVLGSLFRLTVIADFVFLVVVSQITRWSAGTSASIADLGDACRNAAERPASNCSAS